MFGKELTQQQLTSSDWANANIYVKNISLFSYNYWARTGNIYSVFPPSN